MTTPKSVEEAIANILGRPLNGTRALQLRGRGLEELAEKDGAVSPCASPVSEQARRQTRHLPLSTRFVLAQVDCDEPSVPVIEQLPSKIGGNGRSYRP